MLTCPCGTAGRVVAFGDPLALERIGATLTLVPAPLARGARTLLSAAPEFAASVDTIAGAQLELTWSARQFLDTHDLAGSGIGLIGVPRAANGRFGRRLTLVESAAGTLASAHALAATAALHIQMLAVEARLDAIDSDLRELVASPHLELDEGIVTDLEGLQAVFADVVAGGDLAESQWDQVTTIEPAVRRLHHRSSGHLRSLEESLPTEHRGGGEQVRAFKQAIQTNRSDLWLDLHIHAEKALTRVQTLALLHRVDERPERAAELAGALKADVTARFHSLVQLGSTIAGSLTRGDSAYWTDRIRLVGQARPRHLLAQLDTVLESYSAGVGVIQLDAGSAAALDRAAFDPGAWSELAPVAGAIDTRLLERLHRAGSRLAPPREVGSKLARSTLTSAGSMIERLSPSSGDQQ